jgi:hypothetical protein
MKKLIKGLFPPWLLQKLKRIHMLRVLTSARTARNAVGHVDSGWRRRINEVVASPDNAAIPRVPEAGKLQGHVITMHNGVRVCANGYYGSGNLNLLIENKGVHEPQEERAFEAVIRHLKNDCTMLELGAYWGFYSLSLLQQHPRAQCFLIEPQPANLLSAELNFRLNGRTGYFVQSWVDKTPQIQEQKVSVDSFCSDRGIDHLDILHSDIEGFELLMLQGASHMLSNGKIDFIFISTHSNSLHADCIKRLESTGYMILAEANLDETFSYDGLIVAKHKEIAQPEEINISRKTVSR